MAIANAPGAGVADDKAVYAYMPALIKYYLDEEPLLRPGADLRRPAHGRLRATCASTSAKLVVKTTGDSGGYGMLMGPFATRKEIDAYGAQHAEEPGQLHRPAARSSCPRHPTWVDGTFEPRRIDLRPVHPLRRVDPRAARRPHPGGAARRAPTW